jgi:hypothetical protein
MSIKFLQKSAVLLLLLGGTIFSMSSCEKEGEEENITTVEVHLTGPGFDRKFYWSDPDGDGGNAPTIDRITLPPSTNNIRCQLHFYDRSVTPEKDITEEIAGERDKHMVTYSITGAQVTVSNIDRDSKGKQFGLSSVWQTSQASTGSLRLRLYHEPTNKDDVNNPGGEIDIEVSLPVEIK